MRHILFILKVFILFSLRLSAQEASQVFISGTEGHKSYRIPAVIRLPDGKLLAFAEGRVNGSNDFGDINIVMKSSIDNGKTWSSLITIADYDKLQAGNPAPVTDLTDPLFPQGRIFLFYNTGNNHEGEVRKGNGFREVWYKTSADGGKNWADPVNITTMVHRPYQPQANSAYIFSEDWRSYANTPGHAMQFVNGPYRGRILIAANHSKGDPDKEWEDYSSHAYYTDDHGKTFNLSQSVNIPGSNEATAAEISGGRLILNARNQKGDIKARIVASSNNGGETWDSLWFDNNLPDPVCEGTILTIGQENGKYILAFCNAASITNRDNLTLRISYDEGRTWALTMPVDKSSDKRNSKDYTAYSDIVNISETEIGVLYERDDYSEIVFKVIKWK
ncbi:MAG: exo-alpha-sialidase [Bacteroidales bacterium]|nr:exo-alpha-sialidase [Bacteroidales bacterium]